MHYVSTRGEAAGLGFTEVLLAGLARDGGLYVPERWPQLDAAAWQALAPLSYAARASRLFAPYLGATLGLEALSALVADAYRGFRHPDVTPLTALGPNLWLLELFHGPTFAFKDLAMQVLSRLMEAVLARRGERLTIVGATSGDTGAAAVEAFRHSARVDLFMLHPRGRVSEIQRRQMTTVEAPNIHNIAIEGTFDDAQGLVKALFADLKFRDAYRLSGVNSINWARVMAQTAYYAAAALALGAPQRAVRFSVPTGNFGDILAGDVTRRMGLAVDRLIIATNENDILARCLETGRYARGVVKATQSPSMDIQVSSNFERLLFEACGRRGDVTRELMDDFSRDGAFVVPPAALASIRAHFAAKRVDEALTTATMARVHAQTGIVLDPHTAVGVAAADAHRGDVPLVCLATAHWAKFPDAVKRAIGFVPALPDALAALADKPERASTLPVDLGRLKDFIAARSTVRA